MWCVVVRGRRRRHWRSGPHKRVEAHLLSDSRLRAMSGDHHGVFVEFVNTLLDGCSG